MEDKNIPNAIIIKSAKSAKEIEGLRLERIRKEELENRLKEENRKKNGIKYFKENGFALFNGAVDDYIMGRGSGGIWISLGFDTSTDKCTENECKDIHDTIDNILEVNPGYKYKYTQRGCVIFEVIKDVKKNKSFLASFGLSW